MADQVGTPSIGWTDHLILDARVLGLVGWAGLLLGAISLVVTVAGFVIALRQIRKVQAASEASRDAADAMMRALQRQDMTASLNEAKSHLKLAKVLMGSNLGAVGAYIDTSCNALTQVHQIRGGRDDDELVAHILNLRAAVRFLQSSPDANPTPTRARKMHNDISDATNTIDNLIARRRYDLQN